MTFKKVLKKVKEKHLEPCEHVQAGSNPYGTYRVERWVLKDGEYVMTGFVDQQVCLFCCSILG